MFVYFTANIDFKTLVQLQRSKKFLNLSKHKALHVVGASSEFKQREKKGM